VYFIVIGTWLFGERLPADPAKLALRLGGIILAAVVVVLLSRRPPRSTPEPLLTASAETTDASAAPAVGTA
jgi:hypothetical protein